MRSSPSISPSQRAFAPGEQVGFELIEPGKHFGLTCSTGQRMQACSWEHGAARGGRSAEFDLALVEVLLELGPLLVCGQPVLLSGPELAAVVEELLADSRGERGRGLLLANHLCDLLGIRSDETGTITRLHIVE